jgi:threonine/homoserine/homoserine lactone efflux protein
MILLAIIKGIALGLFFAIQPGPSLFALLETSSKRGFKPGLALAFGIFLSDIVCFFLAYMGVAQLFNDPQNKTYIGLVGGAILVAFGLYSILHKKKVEEEKGVEIKAVNAPLYILKGFFLNVLNPSVIFLWILWVGVVNSDVNYKQIHIVLFFSATLLTVFFTDVLKAYYSDKISQRLSHQILRRFNLLLGVILFITGLVFIYKAVA